MSCETRVAKVDNVVSVPEKRFPLQWKYRNASKDVS